MSAFNECPICYCNISDTNCCTTECGHRFCLQCILQASSRTSSCPLCRTELISTPPEDEDEDDEEYEEDDEGEDVFDDEEYNLDEIANEFLGKGYKISDLISMLTSINNVRSSNYKEGYTEEMIDTFDKILKNAEKEIDDRKREQQEFCNNDTNSWGIEYHNAQEQRKNERVMSDLERESDRTTN